MRRRALLVAPLLLAACAREPEPLPHRLFVPAVVRSASLPGRVPWRTRVTVTNEGDVPSLVRAFRWPPSDRTLEVSELVVPPRGIAGIPSLVPALPAISSLTVESDRPVRVEASVEPRGQEGPPALTVPAIPVGDLARPGDRLLVGTFVSDEARSSHFAFSYPWAEHATLPFRVRMELRSPAGTLLARVEKVMPGVPGAVEDPWKELALPAGAPFDLEVTFVSSARGREPRLGMWVYGVVNEKATGASRFLPTRVVRGGAAGG